MAAIVSQGKICDVRAVLVPSSHTRSTAINSRAVPILRQRAQTRGLELDDAVLDWLFRRVDRDLGTLTALLDRLDRASLAAQRRITVPFLRQTLGV